MLTNECRAELALENSCINDVKSFEGEDPVEEINIVILGMSALGRALAITAAYALHFKNGRRTNITIVDEGIENKVHEFKARYNTLFDDSDYVYSDDIKESHNARTDVSWRFINSSASTPNVVEYLRQRRDDSHLYIYVCYDDIKKNVATEVALRNVIDGLNVYSDFGEYVEAFAMYDKQGDSRDAKNGTRKFTGLYGSLKKKDQYSYIFEKRHEEAEKFYEDTNKVGDEWSKLSFSNKHRRVFESVVHKWWNNQEAYDFQTCYRDILSITVYGESGDWFRHLAGNINRYVSINKLKRIQQDYCNLLNNDIEGDLADYLAFENYAIIWDDRYSNNRDDHELFGLCTDVSMNRFIINEDLLNALLCYSVRRNLSDASVFELFKLAAYDFKEKEILQASDFWEHCYETDEEGWIEEDIFTIEEPKEKTEENTQHKAIKVAIRDVLQNSYNQGNQQAKLALLGCELQEKQNASKLWIESFNGIIENLDNQIPEWFLEFISTSHFHNRIQFEVWKSLIRETGKKELLNHYLLKYEVWNKDVTPAKIKRIVNHIKEVHENLSDGVIYLRIANVPGIHIIQKCVWLTKAEQYYLEEARKEFNKNDSDRIRIPDEDVRLGKRYLLLDDLQYIYQGLIECLEKVSDNKEVLKEYRDRKNLIEDNFFYPFEMWIERLFLKEHIDTPAENIETDTSGFEEYDRDAWRNEFPGVPYWEDYKDQE